MREILFRGFHKNKNGKHKAFVNGEWVNGEWCEGNFVINYKGTAVITPDETPIGTYGQVIPETVGQYIGLEDMKGKKIFEGDIIAVHSNHVWKSVIMLVVFEYGAFFGKYGKTGVLLGDGTNKCEVIGNIYDNPELMKGE